MAATMIKIRRMTRKELLLGTSWVKRVFFWEVTFLATFLAAVFLGAGFLLVILINTNKFLIIYCKSFSKIVLAIAGLAEPFEAFMSWPIKKPIEAGFVW